jgi:hypothetical protein
VKDRVDRQLLALAEKITQELKKKGLLPWYEE